MFCSQCFGESERSSSSDSSLNRIISVNQLPTHFAPFNVHQEQKQNNDSRISLSKISRSHKNNYKQFKTQESYTNYILNTETSLPLKPSISHPKLFHHNYLNLNSHPSPNPPKQYPHNQMLQPPSFIRKITINSPLHFGVKETSGPQVRINFINNNSIKQSKETYASKYMKSTVPSFHYNNLGTPHVHARTNSQMNNPSLVSSISIQKNNCEFSIEEGKQLSKSQGFNKSQHKNFLTPHENLQPQQYSRSKSMVIQNLDEISLTRTVSDGSSKRSQFSQVIGGSADLMRDYNIDNEEIGLFEKPNILFQKRRSNLLEYRKDSHSEH